MTGTSVHIPTLETERLVLRAPSFGDLAPYTDFLVSERSRMVGGPFKPNEAFHRLSSLIGHWHLRGFGRWMVTDRGTGEPYGIVGLLYPPDWPEPEIAWTVFANGEGKGIAYEAARAARSYAYDVLGWTTAVSLVDPGNTRSAALARRMGCTVEGSHDHPVHGRLDIWRHPGPGGAA